MIGNFTFNGKNAFNDFGIIAQSVSRPLLPAKRSSSVEIPGTSGIKTLYSDQYDVRTITMRLQFYANKKQKVQHYNKFPNENPTYTVLTDWIYQDNPILFRAQAAAIAAWLGGNDWGELVIEGETGRRYYATVEEQIDLDAFLTFGSADVNFVCQPFAYGPDKSVVSTGVGARTLNITNNGRAIDYRAPDYSLFKIRTVSTSRYTLQLNGKTLTYVGQGTITINNVDMTVEGGDFGNLSGHIDSFLTLNPGLNTLYIQETGAGETQVMFRELLY